MLSPTQSQIWDQIDLDFRFDFVGWGLGWDGDEWEACLISK